MHYQLYIPHTVGQSVDSPQKALEKLGFGDLVAGHEGKDSHGPGEISQGNLISWLRPGKNDRCHFNANEQTWIPSVANGPDGEGKGRYWVGFWNDSPVTPEDLQRPYSKFGEMIELGDGNSWRLPVIAELPRDFILQDDGSWRFELQRQYHDLNLEGLEIAGQIHEKQSINWGDSMLFCSKALSQNYRLLPEVVSHLRLFNTENVIKAIGVLLELTL